MARGRARHGRRRLLRWAGLAAAAGIGGIGAVKLLGDSPAEAQPLGIASRGGWSFPRENPVIKAGDLRPQALWNDPCVLRDGNTYVMYMTSSTNAPFKPPVLPFRAVSSDGFGWSLSPATPLLSPAGTPFASLETPSVVRFRGAWHMFFTGILATPTPAPMAIGHASSQDGIVWKVTPTPVLAASGRITDWNGYLVGEPGAIVWNDRILVYFSAIGARAGGNPPQAQSIGLAITTDGITFGPPTRVLEQIPLYPPSKGYVGYSTPMAFAIGPRLHLVYDVAMHRTGADPEWQQVALHHAVSRGTSEVDFVQDPQPLLTRDDFGWTGGEIRSPSALVEGNKLHMWFAGHGHRPQLGAMIVRGFKGGEFGIGYATRPTADFLG